MDACEIIERIPVNNCIEYEDLVISDEIEDSFIKSIKDIGVIVPVIGRRTNCGLIEVFIGRKRLRACRILGIVEIPCIIRNVNNNEITILIVETSINQTLSDSYRTTKIIDVLWKYHTAIKNQGKRTDLIKQIKQEIELTSQFPNTYTFGPVGEKLNSAVEAGIRFSISPRTVSRYLRLHYLCPEARTLLDNDLLSIRAGVELSYIDLGYQLIVVLLKRVQVKKLNGLIVQWLIRNQSYLIYVYSHLLVRMELIHMM